MNKISQRLVELQGTQGKMLIVGNRIPKDFFITSGIGQSDITVHAGSYHLALKDAGIERCNIITYSSILPGVAREVQIPEDLVHGSVLETIMACSNAKKGQTATAGIIFGWLFDKKTGEKYGGIVCEYSENGTEEEAKEKLKASLNELYRNGFSGDYELRDVNLITRSFVPEKNFGSALVALCFVNYLYPVSAN
jgi:arginine decarboxylase